MAQICLFLAQFNSQGFSGLIQVYCPSMLHSLVRRKGVQPKMELGGGALTGTKATGSRIGLTLHHYIAFCGTRWAVSRHIIPGLTLLTN